MAYFEQFRQLDGSTLYSGTIASTGPGSSISVQYFQSVSVQVTGSGYINATIEGSNDGTNWNTILLTPSNDLSPTDTITQIGGYNFKSPFLYIRYNIAEYNGTQTLTIVGRSGAGESGADKLAAAFNPDTPLQVNVQQNTKDTLSVQLKPLGIYQVPIDKANLPAILGINAFDIGTGAGVTITSYTGTPNFTYIAWSSNPNGPWSLQGGYISSGYNSGPGVGQSGAGHLYYPAFGRYCWIYNTTGGVNIPSVTVAIMQQPVPAFTTAVGITGGTNQNGGVVGGLGVGGVVAAGASATAAYPLLSGGLDPANLARRTQTDMLGRTAISATIPYFSLYNSNSPQANTALPINAVGALPATFQQSAALNVQDSTQFEGQTQTELLAQILLELRILNQQMYELPRLLNTNPQSADPPEAFRAEQSIFNQ